jgi:hypothetical protein
MCMGMCLLYVRTYGCMYYVHMYVCMYVLCTYVCMYVCMYGHRHVCIQTSCPVCLTEQWTWIQEIIFESSNTLFLTNITFKARCDVTYKKTYKKYLTVHGVGPRDTYARPTIYWQCWLMCHLLLYQIHWNMDQLQLQPTSSVPNWNAQSLTLPDLSPKKDSSILRTAAFLNLVMRQK